MVDAPKTGCAPRVLLPVKVDIIFHDKREKSTGLHAKVLSPDMVNIFDYPDHVPRYDEVEEEITVVLYPSERAVPLATFEREHAITRIVLIDSAW